MKDFDLITFDCYGTLIDWEAGICQAFMNEAAKDGLELVGQNVIRAYHAAEAVIEGMEFISYRQVLNQAARDCAMKMGWSITEERESVLTKSLPQWLPFSDTNPALERLATGFHRHKSVSDAGGRDVRPWASNVQLQRFTGVLPAAAGSTPEKRSS